MTQRKDFVPTTLERAKAREMQNAESLADLSSEHRDFTNSLESPFQLWSSPEYRLKPPKENDEISSIILVLKQPVVMRLILEALYDAFGEDLEEKNEKIIEVRFSKPIKLSYIRKKLQQHLAVREP